MSDLSEDPPAARRRPTYLSEFLHDGIGRYEGAFAEDFISANKSHNRFFLLNVQKVMDDLGVGVAAMRPAFAEAVKEIQRAALWAGEYKALAVGATVSQIQLNNEKRIASKLLAQAICCIVALDVVARDKNPSYDVMDYLRVMPANFYVDRLTPKAIKDLEKYHNSLAIPARQAIFRDESIDWTQDTSFRTLCLAYAKQVHGRGLLDELAKGFTASRFVCDAICKFVTDHYPEDLRVGPVAQAGDGYQPYDLLGYRAAAAALRVPRRMDIRPPARAA